ncbi:hypothetical protein [Variovorax sp. MHTC-1]|uniref:hypothetical protein n=1 Tax=Variovorax sp. MHTC-1 TaxID=2495593 RepID=UPI00163C9E42|nr:hypothetical protein [Variovorax sp. MHTC-1]
MEQLRIVQLCSEGISPLVFEALWGGAWVSLADLIRQLGFHVNISIQQSPVNVEVAWPDDLCSVLDAEVRRPEYSDGTPTIFLFVVKEIAYRSDNKELHPLGLMFDFGASDTDRRPRMGLAIASKPISKESAALQLRTLAHEIGHCLNLLHPIDEQRPVDKYIMTPTMSLVLAGLLPGEPIFHPLDVEFALETEREFVVPGGQPFGSRPNSPIDPEGMIGELQTLRLWANYEGTILAPSNFPVVPIRYECPSTFGSARAGTFESGGLRVWLKHSGSSSFEPVRPALLDCSATSVADQSGFAGEFPLVLANGQAEKALPYEILASLLVNCDQRNVLYVGRFQSTLPNIDALGKFAGPQFADTHALTRAPLPELHYYSRRQS